MKKITLILFSGLLLWHGSILATPATPVTPAVDLSCSFGNVPIGSVKTCQRDVPGTAGSTQIHPTYSLWWVTDSEFSILSDTCSGTSMQNPCTITYEMKPKSSGDKTATVVTSSGVTVGGLYGTATTSSDGFVPSAGIPDPLPSVVRTVSATGTSSALSLSAVMNFGSMTGQMGSIFVGARVPPYSTASSLTGMHPTSAVRQPSEATETWLLSNGSSWGQYVGGTLTPSFTGWLNNASSLVSVLDNVNIAGLCGTEFYVGYGSSGESMLLNNTLGKIYTVMCNFAFTASVSGNADALNLTATVQVATADTGKSGSLYVAYLLNGQWMAHNGSTWVSYTGGNLPAYANGTLATRQIQIFNNENVRNLVGAQIFVGYGTSDIEMLSSNRYGAVYLIQ